MKMYRNDLKPDLMVRLSDRDGPIDLTSAVSITVRGRLDGDIIFTRTATGTADGIVTMEWQAGDTANAGRVEIEIEIIWPGDKPQTVRPTGDVEIVLDYA